MRCLLLQRARGTARWHCLGAQASGRGAEACSTSCSRGLSSVALHWPLATAVAAAAAQRRHLAASVHPSGSRGPEDFDIISPELGLARIDGLNDQGFIVNDVQVEGAVMLSGDVVTLWSAKHMADITLDSLGLLRLLKPVPDLLVLGCGRHMQRLPPGLARQLHQMGVRVDALDTANAVSTFNVLNQEGRKVVGALLPLGAED